MIIPSKVAHLTRIIRAPVRAQPVAASQLAERVGGARAVARCFRHMAHDDARKFVTNAGRVLFSRVHPSDMIHRTGGRRG